MLHNPVKFLKHGSTKEKKLRAGEICAEKYKKQPKLM